MRFKQLVDIAASRGGKSKLKMSLNAWCILTAFKFSDFFRRLLSTTHLMYPFIR